MTTIDAPRINSETFAASNDDYHASEGISNSKLSDFIDSPALYWHYHVLRDWQRPAPTPDMQFGTTIHNILPPGRIEDYLTIIPTDVLNGDGHCKGAAWKEFAEAHAGQTLVKSADAEPYREIVKAAIANKRAAWLLDTPDVELNIRWQHRAHGLLCRARLDRFHRGVVIADAKTTRATTARQFAADVFSMGYHRQAAWYRRAAHELTGEWLPFVFIACRKTRPYTVECYELDAEFLNLGDKECNVALSKLARCLETNQWESESRGEILTLSLPQFARYDDQWRFPE